MSTARCVIALAMLSAPVVAQSPGPIRLLACAVSNAGLLEVSVKNVSGTVHTCDLRCDYIVGGTTISHHFKVSIPSRFSGIVGQLDTFRGQPGTYAGQVGVCEKLPST